jgi:hypothetical protein
MQSSKVIWTCKADLSCGAHDEEEKSCSIKVPIKDAVEMFVKIKSLTGQFKVPPITDIIVEGYRVAVFHSNDVLGAPL